jgi:hypothetical protein
MRQVSKDEYKQFISDYPRKLDRVSNTIVEPPMVGYFDGEQMVARYVAEREPDAEEWWVADAPPSAGCAEKG